MPQPGNNENINVENNNENINVENNNENINVENNVIENNNVNNAQGVPNVQNPNAQNPNVQDPNAQNPNAPVQNEWPADRTVTMQDLIDRSDKNNASDEVFQRIITVFGAKQEMVTDWLGQDGGANQVYSKETFMSNAQDKNSGPYSNADFAVLSYLISHNADTIEEDIDPEIPTELISKEDKYGLLRNLWTTEWGAGNMPRATIGDEYLAKTMTPARNKTEQLIAANDKNAFAEALAKATENAVVEIMGCSFFAEQGRPAHINAYMLKKMQALIAKDPELETLVNAKTSDDCKKKLHGIFQMVKLIDRKAAAKKKLAQAQNGEIELSDEEKLRAEIEIETADHYAEAWRKDESIEKKKEHKAALDEINRKLVEATEARNLKLADAYMGLRLSYIRKNKTLPSAFREIDTDEKIQAKIDEKFEAKKKEMEISRLAAPYLENYDAPFPADLVIDVPRNLFSIATVFPQFQNEIEALATEANIESGFIAGNMYGKATRFNTPAKWGSTIVVTEKQGKEHAAAILAKTEDLVNRMRQVYTDPDSAAGRTLNVIHKQMELYKRKDFLDIISADPTYLHAYRSTLLTFPVPEFMDGRDERNNPILKEDRERYEEFMKNHKFLDQIEERQKFLEEVQLPYYEKKKAGNLTPEELEKEAKAYNRAYRKHLSKQGKFFTEIRGYTKEDIFDNRAFCMNPNGMDNWQKDRFGDVVMEHVDTGIAYMDMGWPAEDMVFLHGLDDAIKFIVKKQSDSEKNVEEQERAKALYEAIKKPYRKLKSSYVTSAEKRLELLRAIEEPLKPIIELRKEGSKNDPYKKTPLSVEKSLEEALGRNMTDAMLPGTDTMIHVYKVKTEVKNPNIMDENLIQENGKFFQETSVKVPGGMLPKNVKANITFMAKDLKDADPWYRLDTSSEYRQMKKAMATLSKNVDEWTKELKGKDALSDTDYSKLKEYIDEARKSVKAYLGKKDRQFTKNGNRKEDAGKQDFEQKRIDTALRIYETLNFMSDKAHNAALGLTPNYNAQMDVPNANHGIAAQNDFANKVENVRKAEAKEQVNHDNLKKKLVSEQTKQKKQGGRTL